MELTPITAFTIVLCIGVVLVMFVRFSGMVSDKTQQVLRDGGRLFALARGLLAIGAYRLVDWWQPSNAGRALSLDNKLAVVHSVQPAYPPLARQSRVQGTVRLSAVVGPNGKVDELKLIDGNPLLVPPALEAARQWVYSPPMAHGRPTKVKTEIDMSFQLGTAR